MRSMPARDDAFCDTCVFAGVFVSQVLANHATLAEAVDDICSAMAKRNEDPVRLRNTWQQRDWAVARCDPELDQGQPTNTPPTCTDVTQSLAGSKPN